MNCTTFWRLVWKEFRAQLALWLAFAIVGLALQLIAWGWSRWEGEVVGVPLYSIATGISIFFLLGISGTMLAIEHDSGTFDFLRSLPTTPRTIVLAKSLVAVLGTLSLGCALGLFALILSREGPFQGTASRFEGVPEIAIIAVEIFALGTLCSLVIGRPVHALVATGICMIVGNVGLFVGSRILQPLTSWDNIFTVLVPLRFAYLAALLLALLLLSGHWFSDQSILDSVARTLHWSRRMKPQPALDRRAHPSAWSRFLRLVWQEWHESRSLMWIIGAGGAAMMALPMMDESPLRLVSILGCGVAIITACGASTFLADHGQQRFRFLAERGVPPGPFWFSRQLVWIALAIVVGALAVSLASIVPANPRIELSGIWTRLDRDESLVRWVALMVAAYAVGQFVSQPIRLGIIAWFFAGVAIWIIGIWWEWMNQFVAPLGWIAAMSIVLFLATYQRTQSWLAEDRSWQARTIATAWGIAPLLIPVASLVVYSDHLPPRFVEWIRSLVA